MIVLLFAGMVRFVVVAVGNFFDGGAGVEVVHGTEGSLERLVFVFGAYEEVRGERGPIGLEDSEFEFADFEAREGIAAGAEEGGAQCKGEQEGSQQGYNACHIRSIPRANPDLSLFLRGGHLDLTEFCLVAA